MPCLSKSAVVLAILFLPSRLLSQGVAPIQQETGIQPARPQVAPAQETLADHLFDGRGCVGDAPLESVFVFGGAFADGTMGETANLLDASYDGNCIFGLGYQRYRWSAWDFHLGWEIGAAGRFGSSQTAEFWGGPTLRYDGLVIPGLVKVTPSFTVGLSVVTDTMGVERQRERRYGGDGTLLVYLGPELAIAAPSHPNLELFYRLHHRSGAKGTFGKLGEGYNANVLGLRLRF